MNPAPGATTARDLVAAARRARGPVVRPARDGSAFEVTFVFHDRDRRLRRVGLFCPAVQRGYTALDDRGEGVFSTTVELPRGTRVTYHFTPDPPEHLDAAAAFALGHSPTARRIDRFNPAVDQVHLRGLRVRIVESLLTLPGAPPPPAEVAPGGPRAGTSTAVSVDSRHLRRRKDLLVHRPPGAAADADPPVVLLLQSNEEWGRPSFLDAMVASGVPPFLAVVTTDRTFSARLRDLSGGPEHTAFVLEELWPVLRERFAVTATTMTVAGYSAGGLAAAALAVDEPGRFPRLALVSAALHLSPRMDVVRAGNDSTRMLTRYSAASRLPRHAFLSAGTFEDLTEDAVQRGTTDLADLLRHRGVDVRCRIGPTGHDTVSARAYLTAALRHLLRT